MTYEEFIKSHPWVDDIKPENRSLLIADLVVMLICPEVKLRPFLDGLTNFKKKQDK